VATTPWVAGLYADLFYYKGTDPRIAFLPLEEELPRSAIVPAPPRMEWDEPLRWQSNHDTRVSVVTLELDTGLLPILPVRAWDEVDWQRWLGTQFQNQTLEADTGLLPSLPFPAWDEVDWQRWAENRLSQATTEEDFGLLPATPLPPTNVGWEDSSWSKSFDSRFSQQDDDPWHTFFLVPQPPPTLGWDDWDWSKNYSPLFAKPTDAEPFDFALPIVTLLAYDESDWQRRLEWLYSPQTAEQDLPSQPPAAPSAFDDGEGSRDFSEKRFWLPPQADNVLLGIPFTPPATWLDDGANPYMGSVGSLAAMLVLDDFVNAPSGGGIFGSAPGGRSVRFGFSIPAFR